VDSMEEVLRVSHNLITMSISILIRGVVDE
jgi:hypothetical protein